MVGQKRPLISYLWPYFWTVSFQGRGKRERERERERERWGGVVFVGGGEGGSER